MIISQKSCVFYLLHVYVNVAEWLKRLTRNQFLSEGVGSSPAVDGFYYKIGRIYYYCASY